ncbi:MAG: hypothetical protein LUC86_00335 [Prevotellaceae bacterium]|nr:hypothetical protein [Prevotellaceae bacterium]
MKKKLLFMCALLLSCLSINAQWTEPSVKYTTKVADIPTENCQGVFYHVGQQKYLTGGTTWNTHACLTADINMAYTWDFQLQSENCWMFYSAQASHDHYLFRDSAPDVYTDWQSKNTTEGRMFEFIDSENGYLLIRSAADDPYYGINNLTEDDTNYEYALWLMAWMPNNVDVDYQGNSLDTNIGIFMVNPDDVSDYEYQVDWALVIGSDLELFNAQDSLYNRMMDGVNAGMEESVLDPYATYLTSEDLGAIREAYAAVDELVIEYALGNSSEDNAIEVTSKYIVNPTIEGDRDAEPDGWVDTYGNMLIQNNATYVLYDPELGKTTDYGLDNFSQNWRSDLDVSLEASDLHQVISDLPEGRYILQADCLGTTGSEDHPVSGVALYAISAEIRYETQVNEGLVYGGSGLGYPQRVQVDVIHVGGDLTIGFGFEPGWARWIAVDNFKLFSAGSVDDPGALALEAQTHLATQYVEGWEDETYYYSEASYGALSDEVDKCNDLLAGNDDDACLAEVNVLVALINTVKEEITAYPQLLALLEQVEKDQETFEKILPDLSASLGDMFDTYQYAYEDKSASAEDISEWVEAYEPFIVDAIREAMESGSVTSDNPLDVTRLCSNADFSSGVSDWDFSSDTGNQGSYSPVADTEETVYTVEVFESAFSCLQTLENMPAGQYKLTAKAFYRTAGYDDAYDEYTAGSADILTKLVVAGSTAPVVNIMDGLVEASEIPYTGYYYLTNYPTMWLPNDMQSATYAFSTSDTYDCSVSGYLISDGDLTFGIRNDGTVETSAWSIWGDFNLYYYGASSSALYEQLQVLMDEAEALDKTASVVAEASEKIEDALTYGGTMTESSSIEDLTAAIEQLQEAMDYANECIDLVTELETEYGLYSERMYSYTDDDGNSLSSDEAYPALIAEIDDAIGNEQFESKAKIEEWLERLVAGWPAYVQYDLLGSTIDNPGDISAAIINPSFDQGTNTTNGETTGWTFSYEGDHYGYSNSTQYEGSGYAYEAWNVTSFDMHQTIQGLAQGYYRITVNALYRAGANSDALAQAYFDDPDEAMDVDLYADKSTVPVASVYQAGLEESTDDAQVSYTHDGVTYYVPNTMITASDFFAEGLYVNTLDVYLEEGQDLTIGLRLARNVVTYNWLVFDDFALFYLGDGEENMPEAVESVPEQADATAQSIYDLSGRKVSKAQKGIYIVNGKKVVIK